MTRRTTHDALLGAMLGTGAGDALGLPAEGISVRRAKRHFGTISSHRFLFDHGMFSDDTEHTCMVAQALLRSGGGIEGFKRAFARSLRFWILALPAGTGRATLLACLRLWLGFSPDRSGVFSAGNGPAMRSAILGAFFADDRERMREFVEASTRITHSDPLAIEGAMAVAIVAASLARGEEKAPYEELLAAVGDKFTEALSMMRQSLESREGTCEFARRLCGDWGVSGYILHTVPVAIHAAHAAEDFRNAVIHAIACGGDTDTTAAIAGALAGIRFGPDAIPEGWLKGIIDYPLSVASIRRMGDALVVAADSGEFSPVPFRFWFVPIRSAFFLLVVFYHVLRRLLPPY